MCFFYFLYNFCLKHFSFQEELNEIWSKMNIVYHVKYSLFLLHFNETWIFSTDLSKNTQIPTFKTVRPVGTELFYVDRQTSDFSKARKNKNIATMLF